MIYVEENFETLDRSKWIPFGSPSPKVIEYDGRKVFDSNGDSNYRSGVYLRKGIPLEANIDIEFDAINKMNVSQPWDVWSVSVSTISEYASDSTSKPSLFRVTGWSTVPSGRYARDYVNFYAFDENFYWTHDDKWHKYKISIRHKDGISTVAFYLDGKRIASFDGVFGQSYGMLLLEGRTYYNGSYISDFKISFSDEQEIGSDFMVRSKAVEDSKVNFYSKHLLGKIEIGLDFNDSILFQMIALGIKDGVYSSVYKGITVAILKHNNSVRVFSREHIPELLKYMACVKSKHGYYTYKNAEAGTLNFFGNGIAATHTGYSKKLREPNLTIDFEWNKYRPVNTTESDFAEGFCTPMNDLFTFYSQKMCWGRDRAHVDFRIFRDSDGREMFRYDFNPTSYSGQYYYFYITDDDGNVTTKKISNQGSSYAGYIRLALCFYVDEMYDTLNIVAFTEYNRSTRYSQVIHITNASKYQDFMNKSTKFTLNVSSIETYYRCSNDAHGGIHGKTIPELMYSKYRNKIKFNPELIADYRFYELERYVTPVVCKNNATGNDLVIQNSHVAELVYASKMVGLNHFKLNGENTYTEISSSEINNGITVVFEIVNGPTYFAREDGKYYPVFGFHKKGDSHSNYFVIELANRQQLRVLYGEKNYAITNLSFYVTEAPGTYRGFKRLAVSFKEGFKPVIACLGDEVVFDEIIPNREDAADFMNIFSIDRGDTGNSSGIHYMRTFKAYRGYYSGVELQQILLLH